jgi:hypothetical protein
VYECSAGFVRHHLPIISDLYTEHSLQISTHPFLIDQTRVLVTTDHRFRLILWFLHEPPASLIQYRAFVLHPSTSFDQLPSFHHPPAGFDLKTEGRLLISIDRRFVHYPPTNFDLLEGSEARAHQFRSIQVFLLYDKSFCVWFYAHSAVDHNFASYQ